MMWALKNVEPHTCAKQIDVTVIYAVNRQRLGATTVRG